MCVIVFYMNDVHQLEKIDTQACIVELPFVVTNVGKVVGVADAVKP